MNRSWIMLGCTCIVVLSTWASSFGIPSLKATYEVTYNPGFYSPRCDNDIKQQYNEEDESYIQFEDSLRRICDNASLEVGIFSLEQLSISQTAFEIKYNFTIHISGNGNYGQRNFCIGLVKIVLEQNKFLDPYSNISCKGTQQNITHFKIRIIKSEYICPNASSEVNGSCVEYSTLLVSSSTSASRVTTSIPIDDVTTSVHATADVTAKRTSLHTTNTAVTETTATLSTLAQSTQREGVTESSSGNNLNVIDIIIAAAGGFVIVLIVITIVIIRRKKSSKLEKRSHNIVNDGIPESDIKRKSGLSEITNIVSNQGERKDQSNDGTLKDNELYISYSDNNQIVDKRDVETKDVIADARNVQMNLYAVVNKPKHGKDGTLNSYIATKNRKTNIHHPAESYTCSQIQKTSQEDETIKTPGVTDTEVPCDSTIQNNVQNNKSSMQQIVHKD